MASFGRSRTSSYSSFIVTTTVSCTVFEIKRDIGRKNDNFSYPLVFNLHDPLELLRIFAQILTQTVGVPELLGGATILPKSSNLCLGCNRQTTDGQTDTRTAYTIR